VYENPEIPGMMILDQRLKDITGRTSPGGHHREDITGRYRRERQTAITSSGLGGARPQLPGTVKRSGAQA
jgi:hypothetical protein